MTQACSAALMYGTNLRTVSTPGFNVVPRRIFESVPKPTSESLASASTCFSVKGWSHEDTSAAEGGILYSIGAADSSTAGRRSQPLSEGHPIYHSWMEEKDVRVTLWTNVSERIDALGINPWQLAIRAKVGAASITRMKDGASSQRLDVLERVARFFKVPLWQLLKPADEPLGLSDEALDLARDYDKCDDEDLRARAAATARQFLTMRKSAPVVLAAESSTPEAQPSPEPASPSPSPTQPQRAHS